MQGSGDNVITPRGKGKSTPLQAGARPGLRRELGADGSTARCRQEHSEFGDPSPGCAPPRSQLCSRASRSPKCRVPATIASQLELVAPGAAPPPAPGPPPGRARRRGSPHRPAGGAEAPASHSPRARGELRSSRKSSLARPPPAAQGGEPGPQPAAGSRLRTPCRGSGSAPRRLGAPAAGPRRNSGGWGVGAGRGEVCGPQPGRGAQAGPAAARSLSPPPPPPPLPGSAILIPAPSLLPLLRPSSAPSAARPPPPAPPAPHLGDGLPVAGHRLLDEAENFHVAVPARHDHPGPPEAQCGRAGFNPWVGKISW